MIDRLVTALRTAGHETVPVEVAEALWLAEYAHGAVPHILAEADDTTPPDLSDPTKPGRKPRPKGERDSDEEPGADVYPDTEPADDTTELGIGGPRVPALRGTLALGRALRPLRRRQPSRQDMVLDEALTADRIAQEGMWLPAWKPLMERRFRATVLIDSSASMLVWRRTVDELLSLLEYVGAFRTVRPYTVDTGSTMLLLHPRAASAAPISPSAIADPARRQLIIVMTDGIGAAWGDGRMPQLLEDWAAVNPVQVINLLPRAMWRSTAMATTRARTRTDISVAELSETAIGVRAQQLANDQPPTGPALTTVIRPSPLTTPVELTPAQRVQQFAHNASPAAQRLANCLAAAPLTFPVMRLVQHVMLPDSATIHLAEVFVSGLLRRRSEPTVTDPDLITFDFLPGVRDQLLDIADRYDTVQVLAEVSRFVGERLGQPFDFPAYLAHPDDPLPDLGEGALPFARVSATVLRRLGPRYTGLADRLDELASHTVVRRTQPTRPSDAIEGYPLSGSGTRAVFIGMDTTDPNDLAEVLIAKYGLRRDNLRSLYNPARAEAVNAFAEAATQADDTVLLCVSERSARARDQLEAFFFMHSTTDRTIGIDPEVVGLLRRSRARNVGLLIESDVQIVPRVEGYGLAGRLGFVAAVTRLLDGGSTELPDPVTLQSLTQELPQGHAFWQSPDRPPLVLGPNPALRDRVAVTVEVERPRHVFISYARTDRDYVSRLTEHLERLDIPVWMDSAIEPGASWVMSIDSALRDSGAMVVVVSPESNQSDWVQREVDYMRQACKPIMALRMDGATQAPTGAEIIRSVAGGQMPDAEFVSLLRYHVGLGQQAPPPSAVPASAVPQSAQRHDEPVFFLSFATTPNRSTERIRSLFDDLSMHVGELFALGPGQTAGFMPEVASGADWQRDALPAVNTCRVFVPLLSHQYFRSPFCAKEWHAFARRPALLVDVDEVPASSTFLPVLLTPIAEEVPPDIAAIRRFLPSDLPDEHQQLYHENGLTGLKILDRDVYDAVVWKLALAIHQLTTRVRVERGTLTSFDEVPDGFGRLRR